MNTEKTTIHELSGDTYVPWDGGIPRKEDAVRTTAKRHRFQKGGCDHGSR